jgi:hypothetical protein
MRVWIGGALAAFTWVLLIVRVATVGGPMHDPAGNQAPVMHYVVLVVVVTAMTAAWVVGSAIFETRRRG